jgi:predicted Zn-dependent protease
VSEQYFHELARIVEAQLTGDEVSTCWYSAEASDFVRLNQGKVRQAGNVAQRYAQLRLLRGQRQAEMTLSLSGETGEDRARVASAIAELRGMLPALAEDPHLLVSTTPQSTRNAREASLPPAAQVIEEVLDAAAGHDLVGIYAAGPVQRGFASSLGQRNWHEVRSFHLDFSLFLRGDRAVKTSLSGFDWSTAELHSRMDLAVAQLAALARPEHTVLPGKVRAFLTPAAMAEIFGLLSWGSFGGRQQRTRQSSLLRLIDKVAELSPRVTLHENFAGGVAPGFQAEGFVRPGTVPLIEKGQHAGALVSPRTAREFGLAHTGASAQEAPEALDLAGGELARHDSLEALGTGLHIGNLWYMNYSDRAAARMTGMTRFATFWVEKGEVVAPVGVMRFDDSLFSLLGTSLEALTSEREFFINPSTYKERAVDSMRLPGALLSELTLTL